MSVDMTTVLDVANKAMAYFEKGDHESVMKELYADDAKHVEAMGMGDCARETAGKDALLKMLGDWYTAHEIHNGGAKGPFPHGEDRFAVFMWVELTPKDGPMKGQRHTMEEVCLYTVKDGKISLVEFFWDPTGYGV